MAYELTCPGCGAVVKSPFVRVGAVVTCGQCSTRYGVREQDIRRPSAAGPDPAVVIIDEDDEPSLGDAKDPGGTDATGLSGLSTLMRQQDPAHDAPGLQAPPDARLVAAKVPSGPPTAPPTPALSIAERIAERRRAQRRRRQAGLVVGISVTAALLLIGLIVLVMLMPDDTPPPRDPFVNDPTQASDDPAPAVPPTPANGSAPGAAAVDAGTPAPADANDSPHPPEGSPEGPAELAAGVDGEPPQPAPARLAAAISLMPTPWRRFEPPVLLPPDADDPVRVLDAKITETPGGRVAQVTVISDTLALVDQATLTVALTDEAGQASMAFAVPVSLLDPLSQRSYEMPLPDDAPTGLRLTARVKLRRLSQRATALSDVGVRVNPEADGPTLRLTATTPDQLKLNEAVFTITADGSEAPPLGVWRCTVPGPFAGGTSIRAIATLPQTETADHNALTRARWTATAVGLE